MAALRRSVKCLPPVWTDLHNTKPKQNDQTELDMELNLQMPKHNGGIQCKRSVQSCTKSSLEVCKSRVCFCTRAGARNTGVPNFVHRAALCPKKRYEEEADEVVARRTEIQNPLPISVGAFQLEDELDDRHLSEGNGENGEGGEYQLVDLGLRIWTG